MSLVEIIKPSLTGLENPSQSADNKMSSTIEITEEDHAHEHTTSNAIVSMDTLGITASTICIIHCMAMPFLITLLPLFGWQFLEGRTAHRVLAAFVLTFALLAVVPGYLKHRRQDILASMLAGLSCVLYATFAPADIMPEALELPLITIGNIILVATHWRNRKLSSCQMHSH
jgi:hypothetical protein